MMAPTMLLSRCHPYLASAVLEPPSFLIVFFTMFLLLNDPPRMDKDRNEMSRRILNFTMEIIYLLSGEEYTIVKKTSGDCTTPIIHESGGWSSSQSSITEPPPHFRIHEKNNKKKILELISKITELLTGEVPIRCQDVTVYFSMEEWEYLEGHKDLYEEVMMENYWPHISQDGSSRRNPPERCPSPLYSQDCSEENHNIPWNHQGEDLTNIKVEEEEWMRDDQPCPSEVEEEIPGGVNTDGSSRRNPPERCPSPLYSKDCPEENHNVPWNHQGEDLTNIKVEDEEWVRGDQPCPSEVEEEIPGGVNTENSSKKSKGNIMLSINYKVEDEDIMQQSSGENLITLNVHPGLYSTDRLYNSPNHKEPSTGQSQIVTTSTAQKGGKSFQYGKQFTKISGRFTKRRIHTREKPYSCSECGKCFPRKSQLAVHERRHTGEKPYSCSECGKCFTDKSYMVLHQRSHKGEQPYSCSECGKCFPRKSQLAVHERRHTGEKPYSCSECGKCFTDKSYMVLHQRSHKGEKPYSCSECGKCFTKKSSLVTHERSHKGEKPYSCSECGKCFTYKSYFVKHQKIHIGEKPYSCSECGKCFTQKSSLVTHWRSHTGEKPYSCSECGKCFARKSYLVIHERIHTGEKPFSCLDCEKCFRSKTYLVKHERIHTGEKPFSCSECGKYFTDKSSLIVHKRIHSGEKPYSCSACGKCFITKGKLRDHQKSHIGKNNN
ncbi:uncharacterized protein LOC142659209 isoform X2 [Rhinoderma darwinii]|uniref:uncharacterized protein LOC142659209 isoform X2 n=1 Tax=Rhinoderma darwinii TaxID=43563 RepID=UPI003F680A38